MTKGNVVDMNGRRKPPREPDVALRLQQFVLANELAQRENVIGVAVNHDLKVDLRRDMEAITGMQRPFEHRDKWAVDGVQVFFVKHLPCDFGVLY